MSRTFLILGTLGLVVAILDAALIVASYLRNLPTMDQAGAALGLYFLLGGIAPVAAALLTAGAVPLRLREQAAGRSERPGRAIAFVLATCGLLLAALAALYAFESIRQMLTDASTPGWRDFVYYVVGYGVLLIALPMNVLVVAVILGSGAPTRAGGRLRWLVPLLVSLALGSLLGSAAMLVSGVPGLGPLWSAALVWALISLRAERRTHSAPAT